jgi:hypothetical protein
MPPNSPSDSDPKSPVPGGGGDDVLDLVMSKELQNVPLPHGGLEAILMAVQSAQGSLVSGVPGREGNALHAPIPFTRRRWFQVSAAAAACVVGGGVVFVQRAKRFDRSEGPPTMANFIADAVAKARGTIMLAYKSKSWSDLETFLTGKAAPFSDLAGKRLEALGARGCQSYPWKSGVAGLTCYNQADQTLVHIFTIPRSLLEDGAALPDKPVAQTNRDGRACSWWGEADNFCVMVAGRDQVSIDASLALLLA